MDIYPKYKCSECGLEYEGKKWAEKCYNWCKEHQTCNLKIIKYAIKNMENEKHYCHISVKGLALTGAVFLGGYYFLLALLAGWGIKFMWVSKELVQLLSAIYPGYAIGFGGAILGLVYGLVCGAVCGGLVAWLHNKFCRI